MLVDELADRPEVAEDLRVIEAECLRCRRIVRDLLDLARPSPAASGSVDLEAVAASVLRGLSHHPQFRHIRAVAAWSRPLPKVQADPDRVKQVLVNLLLNAAQAMNGRGTVTVEGQRLKGRVRVTVRDEGPGIPPEDQERIFEPFFTTRSGTGLGLAVSRRLVEEQGGRLWAESRPGTGSEFHLELAADDGGEGGVRGE
jgi:signal transduction histidine kinase